MRFRIIAITATIILVAACNQSGNKNPDKQKNPTPPIVTFCENINYGDTATLHNEQKMKRLVAEIVRLQLVSDSVAVRQGLTLFFSRLLHDEEALALAAGFADRYLSNPASPVRNEGKYIEFLSTMLEVDSLPALVRNVAADRLALASLNRPGTPANNFSFEMPDGTRRSLYDIESPATLVVFYNPECGPCTKILTEIAASPRVNAAIADGRLTVVAIYAEGNRPVWRNSLKELPGDWIVGYDLSEILDNNIYDLPAMPTLYLLDADKRVILKDPDHRFIGKYLPVD